MAIRNFAKYLAVAVLAASCQVHQIPQAPENTEPAASNADAAVIPGVASVQFDESIVSLIEAELSGDAGLPTKALGGSSIIEELGIERIERVFPDAGEYELRSRKAGMHRFYRVIFSADIPSTKASESLASMPGVISAHPVRKYYKRAFTTPNDTYFNRQWHYVNTNKTGVDINVKSVWEKYTTGSKDVIVSVVDESVDPTHPDLIDNLWNDGKGHTGYNFVRDNWDMSIRLAGGYGDSGHGTHVAGTIGAVSNNGKGVAGIAGGDSAAGVQGVRIMSCAVFSGGEFAEDFAEAMKWGADHGAVISQNSWGPTADLNEDGNITSSEVSTFRTYTIDVYDPEIKAAIDYFIEYAGCDAYGNQREDSPMKGGLVLFAAGNEGYWNVDWDPYGGYEPVISVGAFNEYGSRASYSNYGSWVDIAAPAGSGSSSATSVWSTLPPKVANGDGATINTGSYGGDGWVGTSMSCPHASGVAALIVSYFGGQGFTADIAKDILIGGAGPAIGGSKPIGRKLDALSSFIYGIGKYGDPDDDGGQTTPEENRAPIIEAKPSSVTLKAYESAVISISASDPDGDAFEISLVNPGSEAVTYDEDNKKLLITASKAPAGTYSATLMVTDQPLVTSKQPKSATAVVTYTILQNHPPTVADPQQDILQYGLTGIIVDSDNLFSDQDGESLRLSVSVDRESVASARIASGKTVITPRAYGVVQVTISATDGVGASASQSFKVAIVNAQQPVSAESQNVTENLVVRIGSEKFTDVTVSVYNQPGALVLRSDYSSSAFNPISVNVSSLAPGRYTAIVKYGGESFPLKFAKY